MNEIIYFILGSIFGGTFGLFLACLFITSKKSDEDMYQTNSIHKNNI